MVQRRAQRLAVRDRRQVGGSGDQCIAVCDDVNLVGMGEDCVTTMPSRSHQWNDQECTIAHRFMCGFCGGGVAKPTHFTYTDETLTQMAAEDACIARGGHLASAHSQHDADIWDQLIPPNTEVWIGFHDRDMEAGCDGDKFRWTVSCHNIAAIWVAFFLVLRCQRYGC